MPASLSDKAIAVFAFAAYHQMTSGETVSEVVLQDGAGHAADPQGVKELEDAGLLTVSGQRGAFTEAGQGVFDKAVQALRSAAAG